MPSSSFLLNALSWSCTVVVEKKVMKTKMMVIVMKMVVMKMKMMVIKTKTVTMVVMLRMMVMMQCSHLDQGEGVEAGQGGVRPPAEGQQARGLPVRGEG